MKIQTDEDILSGSAVEIMEQFRMRTFDPGEFADTETYLWFLQHNFVRMTGMDYPLPAGSVEQQGKRDAVRACESRCADHFGGR